MPSLSLTVEEEKRAAEIHRRCIVVNMCMGGRLAAPAPIYDGKMLPDRAVDAGVTAVFETMAASAGSFWVAIDRINKSWRLLEARPSQVMVVKDTDDLIRAKQDGKVGMVLGMQNGDPLEDDWVPRLPVFYRLGIRWMTLTYNEKNRLGCGCLEPVDTGLTYYGHQIVKALNYYGILVDLSHVGERTSMDVLETSEDPVVITHANPRARNPHPRNKSDEIIKAVASRGGVMGLAAWGPVSAMKTGVRPTLEDFLDHIEYVIDLVGVDHVGIGLDLNETLRMVPGWSDFEARYPWYRKQFPGDVVFAPEGLFSGADVPNITRGLFKRGYSENDISKIMGGNLVRVAEQVWDKSKIRGW